MLDGRRGMFEGSNMDHHSAVTSFAVHNTHLTTLIVCIVKIAQSIG